MKTQLENALAFANNNVKVFPLSYNSKSEQILSSWKNEATTDVNQIRKWFENTNCNLAIRTGNGLAVIDVDVKNSEEGKKLILEKLKEFPNTFTVQTPSGGYHFYYRVDRLVKCRVRVHEEIDIRGENGYVVGPGSCISPTKEPTPIPGCHTLSTSCNPDVSVGTNAAIPESRSGSSNPPSRKEHPAETPISFRPVQTTSRKPFLCDCIAPWPIPVR